MTGCGATNAGMHRTFLLPFDRIHASSPKPRIRVVKRKRWAHHVAEAVLSAHPFGSLRWAEYASIEILTYQLEPALAMLRHARLRLLIADEVGLGKTVQAGILLNELARADSSFRGLIVSPAGIREQWQRELASKFSLRATVADTSWLAATTRDLPADVNPWALPGIYIASLDLVKRPEVLRALEDVTWDVSVIDEVHGAGPGTARLAAAQAIGDRSRRIVLLTATPPDADPAHLAAIASIGRAHDEMPIAEFRRTRAAIGMRTRRKSKLLPVRLSPEEHTMHRVLERYTSLVWREAGVRQDGRARLAAVVLRKRALSSARSLALSVKRRLALLGTTAEGTERQLLLPLADEDALDDRIPDGVLGASGLADAGLERTCLEEVAEAAEVASRHESKLRALVRLLGRIEEPAVVFTEYRDTLAQISSALPDDRPRLMLHGELTPRERSAAQRAFNSSGTLLLATDAASEGLNLHERCRLVIHFELPWTPMRLEQRTGRVDRLGQTRPVHEVLLMARDTAERLVLAPLLKRARLAATRSGRSLAALDESAVASALMEGVRVEPADSAGTTCTTHIDLRSDAAAEAQRLSRHRSLRQLKGPCSRDATHDTCVTIVRRGRSSDLVVVVLFSLTDVTGQAVHSQLVPIVIPSLAHSEFRSIRAVTSRAAEFMDRHAARLADEVRACEMAPLEVARQRAREMGRAATARERWIASGAPSTAQALVQAGLFDRRALNVAAARTHVAAELANDAELRLRSLDDGSRLEMTARIVAIRSAW